MGNAPNSLHPGQDEIYTKMYGLSKNQFLEDCANIGKDYDKFDAVLKRYMDLDEEKGPYRDVFTKYVAFAVPAPDTILILCQEFLKHLEEFPSARFLDIGAGSGVFCWLLARAGIPSEKLVAVDLVKSGRRFDHEYWDITRDDNYDANKEDLIFVAWGECCWPVIERYMGSGGKRVLILGETKGGCTLASDVFEKEPGWEIKEDYEVFPSANTIIMDHLTVNERTASIPDTD